MQNGNSIENRVYVVFLSDLIIFIILSLIYLIAFRNPYLVKSVNLAFTHALFWSVYKLTLLLAT